LKKTLMIIAGETSGDKHAALLVESMKKMDDLRLIGVGGDRMRSAGVELLHHVREMSVMGFSEVLSKLLFFRKVHQDLLNAIASEKPAAVILVDYPGFNLRFAESAKKKGMKVIYFISPQVWAWGKGRIRKIRRTVDLMLTVFKFEEEMYKREDVNSHFVGHPLIDEIKSYSDSQVLEFRKTIVSGDAKIVALLPGSRLQEISRILPTMLESAKALSGELRQAGVTVETVVACAPGIDDSVYNDYVGKSGVHAHLTRDVDLLMSSADSAMVTSGTATLEAALHELPMVVVYKTSMLNYLIGRLVVRLDTISLVNIVAQKCIVNELVQNKFKPLVAASLVKELLLNDGVAAEVKDKYRDLKRILGGPGASDRAADLILKQIR
jgi:lipid-A-disaccharide synthase